jgi:AraC family transcriptional regulator
MERNLDEPADRVNSNMKILALKFCFLIYFFRRKSMTRYQANEYTARMNRVMDYVENHLGDELSLDLLADIANFSKYHFHRIFYAVTGETLFQFIQRIRLEKGATLLLFEPHKPVTDIALECGFANPASFAKSFKGMFAMSATEWRQRNIPAKQGIGTFRESSRQQAFQSVRIQYQNKTQIWKIKTASGEDRTVEVEDFPPMQLAYIRHTGPYKGDAALFETLWNKLCSWAGSRSLLDDSTWYLITYHDNPGLTEDNKLRMSVCVSVPEETETGGEVGKMDFAGGKYSTVKFQLGPEDYQDAWNWIYGEWLPQSGYVPDDRPPFERFTGEYNQEQGTHTVHICVPVKPM